MTVAAADVDGDRASTTAPVAVGGATEPPTDGQSPGFGLGAAGLGLGGVAAWLARRSNRE
ncbi:hypothetical protein BRC81_07995 [Halobacteriales archaeon QS_1_68_20]|nr:MAG: hypothetical protein BRC81_07995 [Halobacteriales archaeon QS_1_68_20]